MLCFLVVSCKLLLSASGLVALGTFLDGSSLMAIILVDGSSQDEILGIRDATWGAAACVAPQSKSLIRYGYDSVVTFRLEKGDCASAEAYAIIAGARLLRRCGTHSSGRCGTVVVDRSSALSNLVAEIDPRQGKLARDLDYREVLAILLQDLQDAANRRARDTQVSIDIMSRLHAVDLLKDDSHMSHTWQPHILVEDARKQGVHRDDALTLLPKPVPGTWNICAVKYIPDRYLKLLITSTIPCRNAAELGAASSARLPQLPLGLSSTSAMHPGYFFHVDMLRSGRELGLRLEPGSRPLNIVEVLSASAMQDWNHRCALTFPRDQVRPGDKIICVNHQPDFATMEYALDTDERIFMVVWRTEIQ